MKRTTTLFFLLAVCFIKAQQVYTIQSGNWEADSVWYNGIKPDTTGDSIFIYHHINVNSDLYFGTGSYLFIDSGAWFCGDRNMYMTNGAWILNYGFWGCYRFEMDGGAKGINMPSGVVDVGEGGMHFHLDFWFLDSMGCLRVHTGRQQCLFPCQVDTSLTITSHTNVVDFETYDNTLGYQYDFGDGKGLSTYDLNVTHTYTDSGEFVVRLIMYKCCGRDTIYRKVKIELPPPPCVNTLPFIIYPNACDEEFWIEKEFCEDEKVTVRVFTVLGQLTGRYEFTTAESKLKEKVSCRLLAPGNYVVNIESPSKTQNLKLVVVHDY